MSAESITFTLISVDKTGNWTITDYWIGNMVDPINGTKFYSKIPPPNGGQVKEWTWQNDGNNDNPFGLTFNFSKSGGSGAPTQTAIGMVTVDPSALSGKQVVAIELVACSIGPDNPQLRAKLIGTAKPIKGQPVCKFCGTN